MTERDRSDDYAREEAARKLELRNLEAHIAVLIVERGLARVLAEIVSDPKGFRFQNKD